MTKSSSPVSSEQRVSLWLKNSRVFGRRSVIVSIVSFSRRRSIDSRYCQSYTPYGTGYVRPASVSHISSVHSVHLKQSDREGAGRAGHAKNENVKELRSSQDQVNSIKVLISKQIEPSYLSFKHCRIGSFDLHLSVHNAAGLHLTCSRKLWPAEVS